MDFNFLGGVSDSTSMNRLGRMLALFEKLHSLNIVFVFLKFEQKLHEIGSNQHFFLPSTIKE